MRTYSQSAPPPRSNERPVSTGRSSFHMLVDPPRSTFYVTDAGPTRQPVNLPTQVRAKTCAYSAGVCAGAFRSRIRTASIRFSRTDSTRIE
jgi:hypothetical protein